MCKKLVLGMLCCLVGQVCFGIDVHIDPRILRRGDANNDQTVDISDAICISNWLFNGGAEPGCLNQADANNDGKVDVSDSVYVNEWLFNGGPQPPAPGPYNTECAEEDEPYPGCALDPCY